jgi:hypothetical protein
LSFGFGFGPTTQLRTRTPTLPDSFCKAWIKAPKPVSEAY